LIDSTDKHPLVKQLRERIDLKMKELEKEKLEFTKADDLVKESNKKIIENIQKALSNIEGEVAKDENKDLYKFVLADKIGDVVARDAEVNESIYNVLLQRLETAKITQSLQTSKEGTRYTIVDPPRVPLAPFKPNKGMLAGGAAAAGLLLGAGIVFLMEFFDKSFIDVEDAKEFFGTPLLGAISRITTKEEISYQKEFVRWVYVVAIIASVVIVLSSMTVGNLLK
jgi:LPS O-antigen subunit length determinant protein (WzzB/FepE family)